MNMIASTTLKLMRTNWILVMVALPVLFGLFLYWYLGRYDNLDQVFYSYTLYFNCLLPCVIALMISLYTQYEEQIGHFNHLLQLPRRDKWLLNMIVFTWLSVGISTLLNSVPLWLLVGSSYNVYILYYLLLTTLFSLPVIIILWFVALKINVGICLGAGVFFGVFFMSFGANILGDEMWMYVPLLYGTRYFSEIMMPNEHSLLPLVICMFLLCSGFLLAVVTYWFKRWEGRIINE